MLTGPDFDKPLEKLAQEWVKLRVQFQSCGVFILVAALAHQPVVSAVCLICANACFAFSVMASYAVCADIGRNNTGTVTGAMNFFGQMGAFVLAILFGKANAYCIGSFMSGIPICDFILPSSNWTML